MWNKLIDLEELISKFNVWPIIDVYSKINFTLRF